MGLSPNFVKVTLRKQQGREVLVVDGVTPEDPDKVKAIYVGLAHGKKNIIPPASGDAAPANAPIALQPDGEIKSAAPADAPNGSTWTATISQPRPKVKVGEKVVVIGVGVPTSNRARPVFWHRT